MAEHEFFAVYNRIDTKWGCLCQAILSGRQDVTYPPIIARSVLQKFYNAWFEHYFLTTSRSRLTVGETMSTRLQVTLTLAAMPDAPGAGRACQWLHVIIFRT